MSISGAGAKKTGPERVLYDFCARESCSDGAFSIGGLIMDSSGNLYGTTAEGGLANLSDGVVFKLARDGTETVLYRFCSQADCSDGSDPNGGVILDSSGNLYGTTAGGGNPGCSEYGCGTVFKIAPDGTETTLYKFCSLANCTDGAGPLGLEMDNAGNLYGITFTGGANTDCNDGSEPGCGTVFRLSPSGKETVLYSFCSEANCSDGSFPYAKVIIDGSGNLYGTTLNGGNTTSSQFGWGTAFKVAPDGTETVLYRFCSLAACSDGANPEAGLIMDGSGNLFGTTCCTQTGGGVVFKLAPDNTETVLHKFAGGSDGAEPKGDIIMDAAGNLYGATKLGGNSKCHKREGCGTVYRLAPDGTETQLYIFNGKKHGLNPSSGVIADSRGSLYGTTYYGGRSNHGSGVVYKINVNAAAEAKN